MATLSVRPPPSLAVGALLAGKYRLERVVGEGGIGVVLAATHEQLDQRVAVKYLKPRACRSEVIRERFLREARLAARLQSEHIVRVHDVAATEEGTPYIVMEYLEGEDLGSKLERGPLPIEDAVDLVLQACEALAEMHALGIVHRDLKPENLFIARRAAGSPVLKVLDLGISKVLDKHPGSKKEARLTGVTERFGTPQYMPPEQLNASTNVDARADIWALGVVLHELLVGSVPFQAESIPELCAKVIMSDYAGLGARPDAPPGLEAVIARCLAKAPAQRHRNVAELALELAPFGPNGARERAERAAIAIRSGGESVRVNVPPFALEPPRAEEKEAPRATRKTVEAWGDVAPPPAKRIAIAPIAAAVGFLVLFVLVAFAQAIPLVLARHAASSAHVGRALATSFAPSVSETTLPAADPPAPDPGPAASSTRIKARADAGR